MIQFNKGQKVRCIEKGANPALVEGAVYTVSRHPFGGMVYLDGVEFAYFARRFEAVPEPTFTQDDLDEAVQAAEEAKDAEIQRIRDEYLFTSQNLLDAQEDARREARAESENNLRAQIARQLADAGHFEAAWIVGEPALPEDTRLATIVAEHGTSKIGAIVALRAENPGMSLKDAKAEVDAEWRRQGIART